MSCKCNKKQEQQVGFIPFAALGAAAITAAVGVGVDQAVKALEEEKSRYTARFSGRYVGEFYDEQGNLLFNCFKIQRTVGKDKQLAMSFLGLLDLSRDRTAMRVYPLRVSYPKLKAKAVWTDDTAAVVVTLDLTSVWKDKNANVHSEHTASIALSNQSMPIGDNAPVYFYDEKGNDSNRQVWMASDWLIPVVPSYVKKDGKDGTGGGNFSLTATVIETTQTGADIVGLVAETLKSKKPDIVNLAVGQLSGSQQTSGDKK